MGRERIPGYSGFPRVRARLKWGRAVFREGRDVMPDRNGQPDRMIRAFGLVILTQLFAQPPDLHPDNRILFFVEIGRASEGLNANSVFLEQLSLAMKILLAKI